MSSTKRYGGARTKTTYRKAIRETSAAAAAAAASATSSSSRRRVPPVHPQRFKDLPRAWSASKQTMNNTDYRHVGYTDKHLQWVKMCLKPKEEIDVEAHPHSTQLFYVVKGRIDIDTYSSDNARSHKANVAEHHMFAIPAGMLHAVKNPSRTQMAQFWTVYAKPVHAVGLVQKTKPTQKEEKQEEGDGEQGSETETASEKEDEEDEEDDDSMGLDAAAVAKAKASLSARMSEEEEKKETKPKKAKKKHAAQQKKTYERARFGDLPAPWPASEHTLKNKDFRHVGYTDRNLQWVMMRLKPQEMIDIEVHPKSTQLFYVVQGELTIDVYGKQNFHSTKVTKRHMFAVAAGMRHAVQNPSPDRSAYLWTLYAKPVHTAGLVQHNKPSESAEDQEEEEENEKQTTAEVNVPVSHPDWKPWMRSPIHPSGGSGTLMRRTRVGM